MNRGVYKKHFGSTVKFGTGHNEIVFNIEDIGQPFLTYNPDLLEVIAPQLEAELAQELAAISFKAQLEGVLKRFLAGRKPRVKDAASRNAHERQDVAEAIARRRPGPFKAWWKRLDAKMAHHYLRQPSFELIDTAYLLGYEDPNSFIRAYRKWEGTWPGQQRTSRSATVSAAQWASQTDHNYRSPKLE